MKHLSRIALAVCLVASGAHAQSPASTAAAAPTKPPEQAAPAPAVTVTATATKSTEPKNKPDYFANKAPAPGGSRDLVWANSRTKRYHCFGTKHYGKTSQGAYTDETDAIESDFRPSNGKGCSR